MSELKPRQWAEGEEAEWIADKVCILGDYGKDAARVLVKQAEELKQLRDQLEAGRAKSEKLAGQVETLQNSLKSILGIGKEFSEELDSYIENYCLECGDGSYYPTETESMLIADSIYGWLGQFSITATELDVEACLAERDAKVLEDFADELEQKLKTSEFIPVVKAQTTIFIRGLRRRAAECREKGANKKLKKGEIYAGSIIAPDGTGHHIILLDGDNDDADWQAQMDWAESLGGDLPTRPELALLYAFLKDRFKPDYYWSNEQHAARSNTAWFQDFCNGGQVWGSKNRDNRARAVRRVII